MGLFSYNQVIKEGYVNIPLPFRAFFGWHNTLDLHISSLKYPLSLTENLANELILTYIPPKDRLDLWKFTASFKDQ